MTEDWQEFKKGRVAHELGTFVVERGRTLSCLLSAKIEQIQRMPGIEHVIQHKEKREHGKRKTNRK